MKGSVKRVLRQSITLLFSISMLSYVTGSSYAEMTANVAPQITGTLSYTQLDDGDVAIGGIDVADDGDTITATVSIDTGSGTLSATPAGSAGYSVNGAGQLTISGSLLDVNATLDTLVFHPDSAVPGDATIDISVVDSGLTSSHEERALAVIDYGSSTGVTYGVSPTGWTAPVIPNMQNTPDMIDGVTPYGGGYVFSDISGPSAQGGRMMLIIANGGDLPLQRGEAAETVLTGLTIGTTYYLGFQWQQARLYHSGWNINYSGGELQVTLAGNVQVFTSPSLSDDWQTVELSFTAQSTEETLRLEVVKKDVRQAIVVDSLAPNASVLVSEPMTADATITITHEASATPTPTPDPAEGDIPQTGDNNDIAILVLPLGVSLLLLACATYWWIKREHSV